MAKAGLIEEMMNDAIDSAIDTEDIEEETDAEVEKVSCHLVCVCGGGGCCQVEKVSCLAAFAVL